MELGTQGSKFRNTEVTKAGCADQCERIFLASVIEELRHMVPANCKHDSDVVHELEELDLVKGGKQR